MNKNHHDGLVKKSQEISSKWMKVPAPQRGEYIRLFGEELRKEKAVSYTHLTLPTI